MTPPKIRGIGSRSKVRRSLGKTIPLFWLFLAPAHAWGQDLATAEALFNKGVAEIKLGNYKEACPAIAESQKLDPRPGTQFTLAECLARAGKSASAFVAFEDFLRTVHAFPAAQQSRYADRVKVAEGKKAELKPTIPELTIVLPKGAPSGMKITRDGMEVTGPMMGLSLPVDPGVHRVIVELPGKPRSDENIELSPGEHRTLEVLLPGEKRKGVDGAGPDKSEGKPGTSRAIGTYSALGIGAAGLVMGGITGGLALSDKRAADKQCPQFACTAGGLDAVDHGRTMARLSTVGFAVGGVGIAAGVILFLTRPKTDKPSVSADVIVSNTGIALTMKGVLQ